MIRFRLGKACIIVGIILFVLCGCESKGEKVVVGDNVYYKQSDKYYFRDSVWGMKPDDIDLLEETEAVSDMELSYFHLRSYSGIKVNDMDAYAMYSFSPDNDELYRGSYFFSREYSSGAEYIDDFNSLYDALAELYGEPSQSVREIAEAYEDKPELYGEALTAGALDFNDVWAKNDTEIRLSLSKSSVEDSISFVLAYSDTKMIEILNSERKAEQEKTAEKEKGGL